MILLLCAGRPLNHSRGRRTSLECISRLLHSVLLQLSVNPRRPKPTVLGGIRARRVWRVCQLLRWNCRFVVLLEQRHELIHNLWQTVSQVLVLARVRRDVEEARLLRY